MNIEGQLASRKDLLCAHAHASIVTYEHLCIEAFGIRG